MSTNNITETLRALVSDATLLVKQEVSLAKAEAEEKIDQVQMGLIAILSGLLIAFIALLVLVEALVVALANVMPASLAALLVGITLAIVAFVTVKTGQNHLSAKNLKPRRTINAVREDAETLKRAA